jgi:hypothetical protein
VPLLDDRAQFVASERHAIEVGQAIAALDFFADQTELAEIINRVVQIAQRDFEDASFEPIAGNSLNEMS